MISYNICNNPSMSSLSRLKNTSKADATGLFQKASEKAYKIIYRNILEGQLSSGTKLTMRKIAAMSGVSVIPVIEALNRLVEDGLVETRAQWGYFVSMPNRHQVHGKLVLREAVECQVARILGETLDAAGRKKILAAAKELDKARLDFLQKGKGSEKEMERLHYQFHLLLATLTGFDLLVETLRRINLMFILLKADGVGRQYHLPPDWHTQLAEKISAGDADAAEAAMRIHVRDSYEAILESVPESYALPL